MLPIRPVSSYQFITRYIDDVMVYIISKPRFRNTNKVYICIVNNFAYLNDQFLAKVT